MSLTFREMAALAEEAAGILMGLPAQSCTALSPRKFLLRFGDGRKEASFLICLQEPFLRFHLSGDKKLREAVTPISQEIQRNIQGQKLQSLKLLNEDRILLLDFRNFQLIAEFFPKRPNIFLLSREGSILSSLNPVPHTRYHLPEKPYQKQFGTEAIKISSWEIEEKYRGLEASFHFLNEKRKMASILESKIKSLEKLLGRRSGELSNAQNWQALQQEGALLQANLYKIKKGMEKIEVEDWFHEGAEATIMLDPLLPPSGQAERLFKKAKKQRAAIQPLTEQLAKLEEQLACWKRLQQEFLPISNLPDLESFANRYLSPKIPARSTKPQKEKCYLEFRSASGLAIWVGKNAKKNEELTFKEAKGSDWWLHVSGLPGSHVIIRAEKNKEPDQQAIEDAIQLAMEYSKAKTQGEAEVIISQRKFISRFGKGKENAGKVQVSKHKLVRACVNKERLSSIKERNHSSSLNR